jgi:L-fuconolactonase
MPWASRLTAAAEAPNVFAKLSGLDAGPGDRWSAADLNRYIDHAVTAFGPERLMYGSDWPVSVLGGGYVKVWRGVNAATSHLAPQERARIFGGTAMEVYRLIVEPRQAPRRRGINPQIVASLIHPDRE